MRIFLNKSREEQLDDYAQRQKKIIELKIKNILTGYNQLDASLFWGDLWKNQKDLLQNHGYFINRNRSKWFLGNAFSNEKYYIV